MIKLSDTEWKVMEMLWTQGPLTTMDLYRGLKAGEGWTKSTVITLIKRIVNKGGIRFEQKGNSKVYFTNITKEEADVQRTRSFLDKFYEGNVGLLISNLVKQEEISEEELDEIRRIIKEKE